MPKYIVPQQQDFLQGLYYQIDYPKGNDQCKKDFPLCKWCAYDFCHRHGQYQRIKDRNSIVLPPADWGDPYSLTLTWDYPITPNVARLSIKHLLGVLQNIYPEIQYVWRLEWLNLEPHLHMTIFSYTNYTFINIKSLWTDILKRLNHPDPSGNRIYDRPTETLHAWLDYMFKTNLKLSAHECPPRILGQRWSFWGISKKWRLYSKEQVQQPYIPYSHDEATHL